MPVYEKKAVTALPEQMEKIRQVKMEASEQVVSVTKPEVEIAKIQSENLRLLADIENRAFTDMSEPETDILARAYLFALDPLPGINEVLRKRGIEPISIPVLKEYIVSSELSLLDNRHSSGRARVQEFIRLAEALNRSNQGISIRQDGQSPILQRLRGLV